MVPTTTLRKRNIRTIIYLDDFLILEETLEEVTMSRDTTIFLLQHLGFVISIKHSTGRYKEAIFIVIINSVEMKLLL